MQPLGLKNHPFSVILGSSRNVQLVLSHQNQEGKVQGLEEAVQK